MSKLQGFLNEIERQWIARDENARSPTLPAWGGKVNVLEVSRRAGFDPNQEQHLYKNDDLRTALNRVAIEQGLEPIKKRREPAPDEIAASNRIGRLEATSSDIARSLAEREAVIEQLRRENRALREQLALLESTGMALRLREVD